MGYLATKSSVGTKDQRPAIVMQFTVPPSLDDILDLARAHLDTLPEELLEKCHDLSVEVDDFPDTATEQDAGVDDPYELLAVFKGGAQIAPGVTMKIARGADILFLYRRPILDVWADGGEDLNTLIRQIMIGELGEALEFSEFDIDDMLNRHYQGLFL
jgi:predicted Zn-dependent protease with MMP-like domain